MKNILYVEDDEINALIMSRLLSGHYNVQVASDGEQCLQKIEQKAYDLILMDINLGSGKMNGTETMKKLKAIPACSHIPVLAVTSYAMPGDKERFLQEGFDGYFAKPVNREQILNAIDSMLQASALGNGGHN